MYFHKNFRVSIMNAPRVNNFRPNNPRSRKQVFLSPKLQNFDPGVFSEDKPKRPKALDELFVLPNNENTSNQDGGDVKTTSKSKSDSIITKGSLSLLASALGVIVLILGALK